MRIVTGRALVGSTTAVRPIFRARRIAGAVASCAATIKTAMSDTACVEQVGGIVMETLQMVAKLRSIPRRIVACVARDVVPIACAPRGNAAVFRVTPIVIQASSMAVKFRLTRAPIIAVPAPRRVLQESRVRQQPVAVMWVPEIVMAMRRMAARRALPTTPATVVLAIAPAGQGERV